MRILSFIQRALIVTALCLFFTPVHAQTPYNDLQVSVTDHRDNVYPGETLEYIVRIKNEATNSSTFNVKLSLPAVLHPTNVSGGRLSGRDVIWDNVTLSPNQERAFIVETTVNPLVSNNYPIQVVVLAGNFVASDRTVTGNGPGSGNGSSLFAAITDNRDSVRQGETLRYVIHFNNASGRAENDAFVSAGLPMYAEFLSASNGGVWDGKAVRWQHLQIGPGESRDLTFDVRVRSDAPNGSVLRATAYVQGYTVKDTTQVGGVANNYNYGYADSRSYQNYSYANPSDQQNYYYDGGYVSTLPQTGAGDFFNPLENTMQFLTPMNAAAEGNALPLVVWLVVLSAGVLMGGAVAKKFVI